MRLLSLDQSSRITGYAVFEDEKLLTYGKFTCDDHDMGVRLYQIRETINELIDNHDIEFVAFEDIQLQGNVTNNVATFKTLAEVFGVVHELLTERHIPNEAILSTVWKGGLGIKGKNRPEQKKAAQDYVFTKYNEKPTQDEVDAICLGLYQVTKAQEDFDWSK